MSSIFNAFVSWALEQEEYESPRTMFFRYIQFLCSRYDRMDIVEKRRLMMPVIAVGVDAGLVGRFEMNAFCDMLDM